MRKPVPLASAVAVAALAIGAAACSGAVSDYGGAEILLNLSTTSATGAGGHLELWARDTDANVIRVQPPTAKALVGSAFEDVPVAFAVAQAVSFDDPCMIDDAGNLLWQPAAQTCGGRSRSDCKSDADRMQWAKAVQDRIHQLTDLQPTPLLAFVASDDNATAMRPQIAADAPASERLAACHAYWDASPAAYSGSPLELVTPVHGQFFGAVDYQSTRPATLVGGITVKTPFTLQGIVELWLTQTSARIADVDVDQVDCKAHPTTCRGTIYVQGPADPMGWRGVVHFDFPRLCGAVGETPRACVGSDASARSGSATVYVRLDDDPVQF